MMLDQIEYSSPTAEDDHEGFSCMSSFEAAGSVKRKSSKNKKRFSDEQIRSLESLFESESRLEPRKKMQLAKELGLQPRQVAIWFQNKRARWKSKQLERDYSILRANYNNLASKFEALKKEKQALVIQFQKLNDLMRERPEEERQSCGESDNGDAARSESDQIASCESLSLESSYEKATGCIYASTLLYEYRGLTLQPVNVNRSCFQWHLAYCERFSTDFYLTDQKSGLRATVKAGSGCKVIPLVVESKLVNTKRCRLLSPHLRKWLSERNLSTESRLLRLEEGYVQEGSSVTVFGMLHRNNEMTTIVQPPEVISTGCLWRKLLLPVDIDGLILRVSQLAQHSANPNSIQ